MQYFTVQARSDREALEKMKASYGEEARILTHRTVRLGGVRGLFGLEGVELTGYLSEDGARRRKPPDAEEEKKKILENVRREQTLQVLLKEIQGLRESLQVRGGPSDGERTHPTVERIDELLRANEFTEEFAAGIRERIRTTFPLGELESFGRVQNAVVEWIGERIAIDPPPPLAPGKPTVVVLVGPTGVGKTTTVAKLAAVYGIGERALAGPPGAHRHDRQLPNCRQAADRDLRGDHAHPGDARGERRRPREGDGARPGRGPRAGGHHRQEPAGPRQAGGDEADPRRHRRRRRGAPTSRSAPRRRRATSRRCCGSTSRSATGRSC